MSKPRKFRFRGVEKLDGQSRPYRDRDLEFAKKPKRKTLTKGSSVVWQCCTRCFVRIRRNSLAAFERKICHTCFSAMESNEVQPASPAENTCAQENRVDARSEILHEV